MPTLIKPEDTPISIVNEEENALPYVIFDVHGNRRARFFERDDAQAYGDAVNFPEPKLKQSGMRDTGVGRSSKRRAQSKGKSMPRGIPKKKSKKAVKKAAVVKKTAKKTMKRRKRKL